MKKKVLLIALLVALLLAPLSAASIRGTENDGAVGVGLNLGTNMGVGLKFGFGDFDVLANIGLDSFSLDGNGLGLGGDVAFSWNYYTIDGGRDLQFPLTVGAGVTSSFHFGNPFFVNLAVIFPLGIEYNFEQLNPDVPITMYVRLAPGFTLFNGGEFSVKFAFAGYIGALWMF